MKKGIVMQIDDGFLTLLTPEGEFLRAKKQDQAYSVGEEILFFPIEIKTIKFSLFSRANLLKPLLIAAAAFFIFIASAFPLYQNNKAYAYMSIDVNPSIELGVNKKLQVVEITGFNKEGKEVISHLKGWKKKDVSTVTAKIIDEIKAEGYLENKKQIVISTVVPEQSEVKLEKKLEGDLQEIKSTVTDQQLELKVVSGTKSDLEKAHNLGMTTGKYQLAHTDDNKGENKKNSHPKMETSPQQSTNSSANQEAASGTAPPGQAKKQTEPSVPQNPNPSASSTPHNGSENETHPEKSNIPQGQMKKWGEQSVKQNPGQIKKQNNGNIQQGQMKKPQPQTFRQNSGQIKKQENWNKAPSGGKNQPKRFENNNKK